MKHKDRLPYYKLLGIFFQKEIKEFYQLFNFLNTKNSLRYYLLFKHFNYQIQKLGILK